ncbi:unnamed protein product [Symbiodinium natans]|uniref:Apple domain-containing protein n=1 Tax=Symbiodinium natans TaxID=878477 RepID=A0A812T5F4_9DINO|nr:unnamed protein product [Symbiodinium natans]
MCLHGTLQCRLLCCSVPVDQISWGGDRRVCGHFGSHFKAEVWTGCLGNEGVGGNVRGQCCECVADEPPVILPKPMRLEGAEAWLPSHQGQEGYFELPASHEYCDGRVQDDDECSGFNLTCPTGSLSVPFNQACWAAWGGGRMAFSRLVGWRVPQSTPTPMRVGAARATLIHGRQPPSAFCRICESTVTLTTTWWPKEYIPLRKRATDASCVPPTTTFTTLTFTTVTITTVTTTTDPFAGRAWETVGGACRGNTANDNAPQNYEVLKVQSLESCQAKCLAAFPRCKGVEYSEGRCEIWVRPEGIFVAKDLTGFACFRFGWPTMYLQPVDGGDGRACRGDRVTDNQPEYYTVTKTKFLEDCKARCAAAPVCKGIEFSLGRCEIWLRPIHATSSLQGFSCLRFQPPPEWALAPLKICRRGHAFRFDGGGGWGLQMRHPPRIEL